MNRLLILLLCCAGLALSCSAGSSPASDAVADLAPADLGSPDRGVDLPLDQGDLAAVDLAPDLARVDSARDTAPDLTPDSATPDAAPLPGLKHARGLFHLHSAYSHDACDGKGIVGGKVNTACIKQLRDAVCAAKLDFAALTDHPSDMKQYTMQQDLLFDAAAGDKLVLYKGAPIANRVTCKGGHQTLLSVGFESKHLMPLGLHALPTGSSDYSGISDATPLATIKARVAALKAAGAVVAMVHSEEKDISAKTIVGGGFEAMEWYNIHANFSVLIGKETLSADLKNIPQLATLAGKLLGLAPFISFAKGGPHPDLVYLHFLDVMPKEGFDKWREALLTRRITGVLGSDIHQNVSVDASMCSGVLGVLCAAALGLVESSLGIKLPAVITQLILGGGSIKLSDGDRVDSYQRLMRWVENRLLVKSVTPLALQDALRAGRAYGVFSVFGDPVGFSFSGQQQQTVLQLGDAAKGPLTLKLTVPTPAKLGVVGFTKADAAKAQVKAKLLRVDAAGTTVVQTGTVQGAVVTAQVTQPGAYYVEVWLKPAHLTTALGTASSLASKEYLWVISNPIYLTK